MEACALRAGGPLPQVGQQLSLFWLRTELAQRLGITLLLIALARMGHFIALPGVLVSPHWRCTAGSMRSRWLSLLAATASTTSHLLASPLAAPLCL